jgi:hypothetical protein
MRSLVLLVCLIAWSDAVGALGRQPPMVVGYNRVLRENDELESKHFK